MSTIISRLYKDAGTASSVTKALMDEGFTEKVVTVIKKGGDVAEAIEGAKIAPAARSAYMKGIESGNCLVAVKPPFGAAAAALKVLDATESVDIGPVKQSNVAEDDLPASLRLSILEDHPRLMSSPNFPSILREGTFSTGVPGDPLKSGYRNLDTSLYRGTKFWANFPIGHLIPGHKFMAKFPIAHLIPGHKFMAKFPFAHIVPGHKFMAKFPFAHIVPGHKFMARFPFGHIVPGHQFMANWPIPHLLKR